MNGFTLLCALVLVVIAYVAIVAVYVSLSHLLNELGNEIERLRLALVEATTDPDPEQVVVVAFNGEVRSHE